MLANDEQTAHSLTHTDRAISVLASKSESLILQASLVIVAK